MTELEATVRLPRAGRYDVWVGGATRGHVEATVDGAAAGTERAELSYPGQFMPLGALEVGAGAHEVSVRYAGADAAPGSAGDQFALGPPVLSLRTALPRIRSCTPSRADALCAQTLDWVEAVRPVG